MEQRSDDNEITVAGLPNMMSESFATTCPMLRITPLETRAYASEKSRYAHGSTAQV